MEVVTVVIVLSVEQESTLRQMAADLEVEPSLLVEHLLSDRLVRAGNLSLWSE